MGLGVEFGFYFKFYYFYFYTFGGCAFGGKKNTARIYSTKGLVSICQKTFYVGLGRGEDSPVPAAASIFLVCAARSSQSFTVLGTRFVRYSGGLQGIGNATARRVPGLDEFVLSGACLPFPGVQQGSGAVTHHQRLGVTPNLGMLGWPCHPPSPELSADSSCCAEILSDQSMGKVCPC